MKGQVWIETVLYSMIGLVLIGLVLGYALPKINATQQKTIIEQTVTSMQSLDETINSAINLGSGNVRVFELNMKKGKLEIDPEQDVIKYTLDELSKPYSEIDSTIDFGQVELTTRQKNANIYTELVLNYSGEIDLVSDNKIDLSGSPTPYKLKFSYNVESGHPSLKAEIV